MQQPETGSEQQQLQEKVWSFAQRGVVLLVAALVGLYIGYFFWGQAGALKEQVSQLEERVSLREKERDTLKSQMAIIDRDKKEAEKRLQDLQARCAPPAAAAPAASAASTEPAPVAVPCTDAARALALCGTPSPIQEKR